ncbi:MAG: AbrB/MazE/SpoVT family DNA-binding domain-containing protein [Candidatus Nanohaloarchaea archaeon]
MVRLQKDGNGRYHITLPKKFIEGFRWEKGDEINFEITGSDTLKITREE